MYRLFFFCFTLLLFVACNKTYNSTLDIPYQGDKLVLNGIISPDSVRFQLTKSLPLNGQFTLTDYYVNNGQIWIEDENNQKVNLKLSSNGFDFFQNIKILKPEQKYKIFASADGFKTVETSWITIPKLVQLSDNQQELKQLNCDCNKLNLFFQDTEKEKNYYNISFVALKKAKKVTADIFLANKAVINNNCYTYIGVFDDNCFDGQKTTLEYGFMREINNIDNNKVSFDTLQCRFGAVSKDAFDYKNSQNKGAEFIEGINEPLPSYTNITNGYGFVFAQNWQNYFIKVK